VCVHCATLPVYCRFISIGEMTTISYRTNKIRVTGCWKKVEDDENQRKKQ
jgi:hypothetical protein